MKSSGEYTYYRINYHIRLWISVLLEKNYSIRSIARAIGLHHSSVSREIKRNSIIRFGKKLYHPRKAHKIALARERRERGIKVSRNKKLINIIHMLLKGTFSPDAISGFLRRFIPECYVSHETIYKYIYEKKREWIPLLARGHKRRRRRTGKYKNRGKNRIPGRVPITKRPDSVLNRKIFGHFEADLMVTKVCKAAILVLIERKTRFVKFVKINFKKAINVKNGIIRELKDMASYVRSITYDNGLENVLHEKVNEALDCKSYFCNPYHSWEKGSVENVIGLLRRFIPKKTDISKITERGLKRIERLINNRPRKLLNYYTPLELFKKEVVR